MGFEVSLRELCDAGALFLTDGYRTRRDQLAADGAPILRVAHVREGFIEVDKTDRISRDFAPRFSPKTSRVDDVVITTKGTVGRSARIHERFAGFVYSPQVCVLRALDREVLDPAWLYCWVRSPKFQDQLDVYSGQTDMAPYVKLKDLLGFCITVPPIDEQRAIAEVLGALDDRIEWCVATAARVEDLIFELSRGAGVSVPVSELGDYVNGGAYTKHATGIGRLVIRIAELSSGVGPSSKYAEIDAPPERTAYPGDILFSWSATLDVYRWTADEAVVNQHIFKVIPADTYPAWLVFAKLKEAMPTFQKIAHDRATTMGHIKRGHLEQVSVEFPATDDLEAVRDLGDALWEQHLRVCRERQHLAVLRDDLLPRLLSGELRIEDPARVLAAVA